VIFKVHIYILCLLLNSPKGHSHTRFNVKTHEFVFRIKTNCNKLCGRRQVHPTRYAPARVQPNFTGLYSWPWQLIAHAPTAYQVRRRHTFGFSINRPGDLTSDLYTSNLMRNTHLVGNLPTIFGISGTFCYFLMGQHLSDGPRDLTTLTFDLGGHSALVGDGLRTTSVYQV